MRLAGSHHLHHHPSASKTMGRGQPTPSVTDLGKTPTWPAAPHPLSCALVSGDKLAANGAQKISISPGLVLQRVTVRASAGKILPLLHDYCC